MLQGLWRLKAQVRRYIDAKRSLKSCFLMKNPKMLSFKKIRFHTFMIIEFFLNKKSNTKCLFEFIKRKLSNFPQTISRCISIEFSFPSRIHQNWFTKWFFHCKSGVFSIDLKIRQLCENQNFLPGGFDCKSNRWYFQKIFQRNYT